jgi:hypothetical protein
MKGTGMPTLAPFKAGNVQKGDGVCVCVGGGCKGSSILVHVSLASSACIAQVGCSFGFAVNTPLVLASRRPCLHILYAFVLNVWNLWLRRPQRPDCDRGSERASHDQPEGYYDT